MKIKRSLKLPLSILAVSLLTIGIQKIQAQEIDLENGIILYLPFNGSVSDESGNNIPANLAGPELTADRYGNPDKAYLFDGNNDHIILNNNQAIITEKQFTICMWARIDGRSQAEPKYNNSLFEQRNDDPAASSGIHFAAERIINTHLELRGSTSGNSVSLEADYPGDGTWYHFAASLDDNSTMSLYINGELKTSRQFTGNGDFKTGINRVNIGTLHTGSITTGAFNGAIDEVYIYNRALKYCEIETLYSGQLLRER